MATLVFDTEIYKNYFLAAFMDVDTGEVFTFEKTKSSPLDTEGLKRILSENLTVGFNTIGFDLVLTYMAIAGYKNSSIKGAADKIIIHGVKHWEIARTCCIEVPQLDHIDLIEVAPGQASLKIYGGRLHCRRMQDLPIDPDAVLTREQADIIRNYCINDLETTAALFRRLRAQIALREAMSKENKTDLRSKSDAQIAEAVIRRQIAIINGNTPQRPHVEPGTVYRYRVPSFIQYTSPVMLEALDVIRNANFVVAESGSIEMPPTIEGLKIRIGDGIYRMGIGGLHSSEKKVAHISSEDIMLRDADVTSYYPAIILLLRLFPKHLGKAFLKVYGGIVDTRVAAKHAGNKVVADSLKIVVNGSFGKFGSKWSSLYSPDLLIQVTVTGQLSLLMLIERLEQAGITVVSANTDGVVSKFPKHLESRYTEIVEQWQRDTGFELEFTDYCALYSRDVNNYYAIKGKGIKTKGAYAEEGLQKNPANLICSQAVGQFLTEGISVSETIRRCRDITRFVTVRTVQGGAVDQNGDYLGKAVRFYYARGVTGSLHYKKNGNKVPRSDGARPLMDLPDEFPSDVDYDWYIAEAEKILEEIGWTGNLPPRGIPRELTLLLM